MPSLNRDFSAPVVLETNLSLEQNLFLLENDDNSFNRYEIAQTLFKKEILAAYFNEGDSIGDSFYSALRSLFLSKKMDNSTKALALTAPSVGVLFQSLDNIDVKRLVDARKSVEIKLSKVLRDDFHSWLKVEGEKEIAYDLSPAQVGKRSLKAFIVRSLIMPIKHLIRI